MLTKDFSDTVTERLAKDQEFALAFQRELGEQIARADKAEAQIAEAVRECHALAKNPVIFSVPLAIRGRYPEYFKEDA